MTFSKDVGLLYPGKDSLLLDELAIEDRPEQLVVLDGTWHHTKTLVRDIPQLQSLKRYRLAPSKPSTYTIRREPNVQFLSTLEATVAALRCLEPETSGLELLVAAFEGMIENQLTFPMPGYGYRRNHRRSRLPLKIPRAIRENFENIVVVYGEASPGVNGDRTASQSASTYYASTNTPVYWVAERMVSGERFVSAIEPPFILPTSFLEHSELTESAFADAASLDAFRDAWEAFLRPNDIFAFYFSNMPKLLDAIGGRSRAGLSLKSIKLDGSRQSRTLEQILESLNVVPKQTPISGRAGKRLANSVALVSYLRGEHDRSS